MKRLLLLRHAKAVPGTTKTGDHGRPLNERGRLDAPRMGIAMQHKRYLPDRVLCSTALRTLETWEHVAPELDDKPDVSCGGEGGWSGLRTLGRGVNVAFCDGSVRFIDAKVNLDVWHALGTRNGGEVIPNF